MRDAIKFASTRFRIASYLPDYEYNIEPYRDWICNLVNSLIPNESQKVIKQKEDERRKDLLLSSNLAMKVKPEILNIFKESQSVSIVSGRSHYLTRDPKTTKDKIEINIK